MMTRGKHIELQGVNLSKIDKLEICLAKKILDKIDTCSPKELLWIARQVLATCPEMQMLEDELKNPS